MKSDLGEAIFLTSIVFAIVVCSNGPDGIDLVDAAIIYLTEGR